MIVVPALAPCSATAAEALVEKYLYAGNLAEGQRALEAALAADAGDDTARFGLGVLQIVRGVERLGQSLHKYGVKTEHNNVPFLRLPVPPNDAPSPISYADLRRMLDDFDRDLAAAEATLSKVTSDDVKLPLRLALIRLDLTGSGHAGDKLIDILKKITMRQQFAFLDDNPEFLVAFDRGDVAWLRAYCHLLMGMLDAYLAFDAERLFQLTAQEMFAKPKGVFAGDADERRERWSEISRETRFQEPRRLGQFRRHFVAITTLNDETWKYIRAETDDDHEWLPNPKQTGVLGLPVRDEMIDAWLAGMTEARKLFDGERTLPPFLARGDKRLNLKIFLDDPPAKIVGVGLEPLDDKYFTDEPPVDFDVLGRFFAVMNDPMAVAYAAWFN
ncbi:MAG TPA: hypothetical protein VHZ24_17920 [Pirellulales bacterium]|nr:hypothetical protein [Pirellulales bacterium]